ncbi:hypothetical protein D9M71_447600 [compost metagenome]
MRGSRDFVVNFVDGLAAPAQGLGRTWNVDVERVTDRLAHIQGFQQGQFLSVLLEQAGKADHGRFALGWRKTRPGARIERTAGVFDGTFGVGSIATGDMRQEASVDRADALECRIRHCGGVFAVDEGTAFDLQVLGTLFPVSTSQGGHTNPPLVGLQGHATG